MVLAHGSTILQKVKSLILDSDLVWALYISCLPEIPSSPPLPNKVTEAWNRLVFERIVNKYMKMRGKDLAHKLKQNLADPESQGNFRSKLLINAVQKKQAHDKKKDTISKNKNKGGGGKSKNLDIQGKTKK